VTWSRLMVCLVEAVAELILCSPMASGAGLARGGTMELRCATSDGPTSEFRGGTGVSGRDRKRVDGRVLGHDEDRPVTSMMRTGQRQCGSPPL
jgi:hypothetical protein